MNVTIRKIGNSEGVIIPKEILDRLGLKAGDTLGLRENNSGITLVIEEADLTEQLKAARLGMDKYRVALRELAKMSTPKWLSREAVEIMHSEQLVEHGGLPGLKDENALEAALARPLNKMAYGETDIFALAAAYMFGIVRNHPFSDGNKRTGFLAAFTFLVINGHVLEAEQPSIIEFVLAVAAGEIDEDGITRFLRDFSVPYAG